MSCVDVPVGLKWIDVLLSQVHEDLAQLPRATVPLVGALVSVEASLPGWLRDWLMAELGQRVSLEVATPAAEAVMRIREFGRYLQMDFAQREITAQYTLLQALGLIENAYQAIDFMRQLACRIDAVLALPETSRSLTVHPKQNDCGA